MAKNNSNVSKKLVSDRRSEVEAFQRLEKDLAGYLTDDELQAFIVAKTAGDIAGIEYYLTKAMAEKATRVLVDSATQRARAGLSHDLEDGALERVTALPL